MTPSRVLSAPKHLLGENETTRHEFNVFPDDGIEAHLLRQEFAYDTAHILVGATFPGDIGTGEEIPHIEPGDDPPIGRFGTGMQSRADSGEILHQADRSDVSVSAGVANQILVKNSPRIDNAKGAFEQTRARLYLAQARCQVADTFDALPGLVN